MLQWTLANSFGILRDTAARIWNAGHVNDVFELSPSAVLVASDGGGVWQLDSSFGLPLSGEWPSGDTTTLALLGADWVLAGGTAASGLGFLFTTDPTARLPLWTWRPVTTPDGFGSVTCIEVAGPYVVVATVPSWSTGAGGGVWYSRIPAPSEPDGFEWRLASGVSGSAYVTGLAIGPHETVVVGADGSLYHGGWHRGSLSFSLSRVSGPEQGSMPFLVVASSKSEPSVCYASSVADSVVAVLRSTTGGRDWVQVNAYDRATPGVTLADHSQGGYTGALAVSPFDPDVVVLGYTLGPWISTDGAATFFTPAWWSHDDKHRYRFTSSGRLYEACDGGVFFTDDLADLRSGGAPDTALLQMHSQLNARLANLQCLGPTGIREWWGRTNASQTVPGLLGAGLQDNSDVYSLIWPGGSATPWQTAPPTWGLDGKAIYFLDDGSIGVTYGSTAGAYWSASSAQIITDPTMIQVRNGKPGIDYYNGGLPSAPMIAVPNPTWRNAAGELLYAVSAAGNYPADPDAPAGTPGPPYTADIYGLFVDGSGTQQWDYLVTLPVGPGVVVSAIATLTGQRVLVGVRGDSQLWHIDFTDGFAVTQASGLPYDPGWTHYTAEFALTSDDPVVQGYVLYNSETIGDGFAAAALYYTPDGIHWSQVATDGLPLEVLYCLLLVDDDGHAMLITATDTSVYTSTDGGATWTNDSAGLPARPHSSDLCLEELSGGRRFVYLATFGWSVWVAELPVPKLQKEQVLYHYPFLYPDDAPRVATLQPRLTAKERPRLGVTPDKSDLQDVGKVP